MKKVTGILAAVALAIAPTAATAAHPLSLAGTVEMRAGASLDGASYLQDDDDDDDDRVPAIALGFLVLVAIIAVAVMGGDEPSSP